LTPDDAVQAFASALTAARATIVQVVSHLYPGQGLTTVAILEESHAVLHTWPEAGIVHVDIFSCSGSLDANAAIVSLGKTFEAASIVVRDVPRASELTSREALT
jgi:S-adenosylmethionine/arginine decarboxylase-like enzyme